MTDFPVATTPAPGVMGVDWEERVDFARLRSYRLDRVRQQLEAHGFGGGPSVRDIEHPLCHCDPDRLLGLQQG